MSEDGLSVRLDEPLAAHLPLRTGGRCEAWVVAHTIEGLTRVVRECRRAKWPVRLIGAGTRTVARDGAHRGVVLRLGAALGEIRPGERWVVGASCPVPALVSAAEGEARGGLEAHAVVPGSVGASLRLDHGWDELVEAVWAISRDAERELTLEEARRRKLIITKVALRLPMLDSAGRRRLAKARALQRPVPSASVYSVPRKVSVREVLRSSVLERVRLRGIVIPAEAPELLVNIGGGSAADARLLQRSAIDRARRVRGIELRDRVDWIGGR